MRMGHRRVTMTDVARMADVSVGTVSRVVNNHATVDPDLRERVRRAMRELGYRPNALARSMRTRMTMSIGCLVPSIAVPYYAQPILSAEEVFYARGYTLSLTNTHGRLAREVELLDFFRDRAIDGMLATVWPDVDAPVMESIAGFRIPVVLLQRSLAQGFDSAGVDYRDGLEKSISHLAGLGHRRIGIVIGRGGMPDNRGVPAFVNIQGELGLEFDPALAHFCGVSEEAPYMRMLDMLALADPPTAVICGTSQIAGILRALHGQGIAIPGAMSLVSLGETDLSALHAPPITAIRWDNAEVGRAAADLLLRRIAGGGPDGPTHYLVQGELVVRASTAPPAGSPRRSR